MATDKSKSSLPVIIENGPCNWQVLQQDSRGKANIRLSGTWSTIIRRKKPEVMVRVTREGSFGPLTKELDWARARLTIDRTEKGNRAGRFGTWSITVKNIPCGGPYRVETNVGSSEDAVEWRRCGETVHFLCVGDIWLIAGQSNAEGYARDPVDDPSEIGVHQLTESGWGIAAHETRHHPWLMFAKKLKSELGYPVGLIPTAVGGSSVSQWDPGQHGVLFTNMRKRLNSADNRIRGCLWYQGESDTGEKDYPRYKARFARFVRGVRKIAKKRDLPFITVQLNRVLGRRNDGEGWDAIREIQRQIAHEMENVYVFPIFEAGLCDGIHISSLGNMLIAERAAAAALGGVYGLPTHYLHPECVSARMRGTRVLDLKFDNVVRRLDYECALEHGFPFLIRDGAGIVPVSGYSLPRRDVFRIELARPLQGRAYVTGAAGNCPPHVVPKDIDGYRCILAFTRDIEQKEKR